MASAPWVQTYAPYCFAWLLLVVNSVWALLEGSLQFKELQSCSQISSTEER